MKLYERFGDKGFHTTLMTSFGIDFDAYENIVLSRLRGSGCHNNILIGDSAMLSYALEGASAPPRSAGRLYSVTGARARGVFHPKIVLQLGRKRGRLIVISANITAPGLAGNLEIGGVVECTAEESSERRMVAAAWQYLTGLFDEEDQAVAQQLSWMRARTSWLFDTEPAQTILTLQDGTPAAFLPSGQPEGIAARFVQFAAHEPVQRLIVISPYWDDDLEALRYLTAQLTPDELIILIDPDRALFPAAALHALPQARLLDLREFSEGRFVHAKAVIAQTAAADHALFGSANCTVAALGTAQFPGTNAEACLYRRMPAESAIASLKLDKILSEAPALSATALPAQDPGEELPLEEMSRRFPGRFECLFDTLFWWPPGGATDETTGLVLFDTDGQKLPCTLTPLPGASDGRRRFRIAGTTGRPAFARLHFEDGTSSARAIVALVDELKNTAREPRSRKVELAIAQLDDETEEGLWLLEVLDQLEAAEAAQAGDDPIKRDKPRQGDAGQEGPSEKLPYEQFIAGRRLRSDERASDRSSLAGSEMSMVRAFLNRILAVGPGSSGAAEETEEDALARALDLGDEIADAAQAIESGEEFATEPKHREESEEERARRQASRRRANREQILAAVEAFNGRIKAAAHGDALGPFEVLRLRAMLMIVASAGWHGTERKQKHARRSSLQVLPVAGTSDSWPRTMGRVLFAFFGGKDPAINHVRIDAAFDQLTDDLFECWITCIWAAQACLSAITDKRDLEALLPSMTMLTHRIYELTRLDPEALLSRNALELFEALNGRFAKRLGLDPAKLESGHLASVDAKGEQEPVPAGARREGRESGNGVKKTVGILAYGSLIDDPGEKIHGLTVDVKGPVLTPFRVEFARKSRTRGNAPTLVPVENGGSQVQAKILVLDASEQEAENRLYCRETRKEDTDCVYKAPKDPGPNDVVVKRIEDFEGVDVVLYTSIGANIEPLTAAELARLAIGSAREAKPGLDGLSYLIAAKRNGITTALSDEYEGEILRQLEVPTLDEALAKVRDEATAKKGQDSASTQGA